MACGDDSGSDSLSPDLGSDLGMFDAGSDLGGDGGPIDGGQCDIDDDGFESEACGGDDCNDEDPLLNPGNVEVCDMRDNDCDGDVDETVSQTVYLDADGDGFGDASESMQVWLLRSPKERIQEHRYAVSRFAPRVHGADVRRPHPGRW